MSARIRQVFGKQRQSEENSKAGADEFVITVNNFYDYFIEDADEAFCRLINKSKKLTM